MSLSDSDLELLESHLDGELSVAEDEALRDRMNIEPELATALETLRGERDARRGAFALMEPDDAAVARFNTAASREIQRIDRETFWRNTASRLRVVAAAAACLVIGFSVGRIADSGVLNRGPREQVAGMADPASPAVEVVLTDDQGRQLGVQRFTSEERARQFINDCQRWQEDRQRGVDALQVTPVSQQEEQF